MSSHHQGGQPPSELMKQFKKAMKSGDAMTPEQQGQRMIDALNKKAVASGKTGDYPSGMYGPHDEGGVQFAIATDMKNRKVALDFQTPVAWMAMDPEQAIHLGNMLIKHAREVQAGKLSVTTPG